ncbi:MAG: tetratricopeptide repeat protein [Planctomycetes bacterium]|nr:tetratricopeptide repeat protein [Planctomycetota bacterium]
MRTNKPTTIAILTLALFAAACTQTAQKTVQRQNARNWLDADPTAISTDQMMDEPKILPQTHFAAARLLEKQGQFEKAVIQYRRAIAVQHEYVAAYNALGVLLGRLGRHADAENALRRAVEIRPDAAQLRNNLGYEYVLQARWADAEAELSNAIRLKPDFARAWINLGLALSKQQRFEEALDAFRTVLPETDAFYNLGLMFRGQHRYRDAADAFEHVVALNPRFSAAKQQLEQLEPRLAMSTPLEPVAKLNEWPAVVARNDQHDAGQVQVALATETMKEATPPEPVQPDSPSEPTLEDDVSATLTSSETTIAPGSDDPRFDTQLDYFSPCPDVGVAYWNESAVSEPEPTPTIDLTLAMLPTTEADVPADEIVPPLAPPAESVEIRADPVEPSVETEVDPVATEPVEQIDQIDTDQVATAPAERTHRIDTDEVLARLTAHFDQAVAVLTASKSLASSAVDLMADYAPADPCWEQETMEPNWMAHPELDLMYGQARPTAGLDYSSPADDAGYDAVADGSPGSMSGEPRPKSWTNFHDPSADLISWMEMWSTAPELRLNESVTDRQLCAGAMLSH